MFKTFVVTGTQKSQIENAIELKIKGFLSENPLLKEVSRKSSISTLKDGPGILHTIIVDCEFDK